MSKRSSTTNLLSKVLFVAVLYWVISGLLLRRTYLQTGLEPQGSGSVVKDLVAYAFTSIPRLIRVLKTGTSSYDVESKKSALEGFHTTMEFSSSSPSAFIQSPYFAENYYFWLSDPNKLDFLVTTRLSFYGVNASLVIPWFTFQLDGEEWNLPDDYTPLPHDFRSDPRIAKDPKHGTLLFENPNPMREWRLTYKGLVQNKKTGEKVQVDAEFNLEFSTKNVFLYQINWDEMATALSLASKEWNEAVFRNLRDQNQERYASKTTRASGYVHFVDSGKKASFGNLIASRDHLWGIRNWLFTYRYIWWPPITLKTPLEMDGIKYTSFIGAFVEYGNTLGNMVVGGLMSENGDCASFSGATSMRSIAPEWYDVVSKRGEGIGEKHLPRKFKFQISLLQAKFILDVELDRGTQAGMWSHSFFLSNGDFEIHEALTKFSFAVRRVGQAKNEPPMSVSTATGLFEFGGNLLGKVSEG